MAKDASKIQEHTFTNLVLPTIVNNNSNNCKIRHFLKYQTRMNTKGGFSDSAVANERISVLWVILGAQRKHFIQVSRNFKSNM